MNLTELHGKRIFGRRVKGMAAVLLPFDQNGDIADDAYARMIDDTLTSGLTPAVNMDTGYVNLLTDSEKAHVLGLAKQAAAGRSFVAGAYIEGQDGDIADLYRREVARIAEHGGTPILFQTSRLHGAPAVEIVRVYDAATKDVPTAYAFELGKMFAPNGEIWPDEVFEGILSIPQIKGMKHSSLDRVREAERLTVRDRIRPDFAIFTGNDLGIDMIEYGSDYLLGLAAFSPSKFAERDQLWAAGDTGYLEVADALQLLGNVAFRPPVPAYKHSAAVFLRLLNKIPTSKTHPRSQARPESENEILQSCAERLRLL
jgi:dihydrodipicolinate synthase/N-acetylneuraminate lyase